MSLADGSANRTKAAATAAAVLLAFFNLAAAPPAGQTGRDVFVLLVVDQNLYLCPPCGERLVSASRALIERYGRDRVWIIVSPAGSRASSPAGELETAISKRVRMYLQANGCPAPVILDASGAFRAGRDILPIGIIIDPSSGTARSFLPGQDGVGKAP